MRITDLFMQSGGPERVRKSAGVQKSEEKKGTPASSPKDSVSLSKEAQAASSNQVEASAVRAHVDALPDVREDRIAEVKSRIENGYYDSEEFKEKLADRLINDIDF